MFFNYNNFAKQQFCFFLNDFIKFHIYFIDQINNLFIVKFSINIALCFFFLITIVKNVFKLNFIFEIAKFELSQKRFIIEFFIIQIQYLYLLFVVKIDNKFELQQKKVDSN